MNEFDKVRKYWPDRQIFQGSAWAYIRYCENWQRPWERFEKTMWQEYFQHLNLDEAGILDIGSATGKLIDLLIAAGAKPENILAMEPNPILINYLFARNLGVGCISGNALNLDNPLTQQLEADLVTANMVVNHLATPDYDKSVKDTAGVLKLNGMFAYMVPNPQLKAQKYDLRKDDNSSVIVEEAPWGGLVEYHHRSKSYQADILKKAGFKPNFYIGGYDDPYHPTEGPKRMLVVAQKKHTVK